MIDLQPQGLRHERLEVLSPESIQIGSEIYPVHDTGIDEVPGPGIHVDVIAFDDPELAKTMDAAFIQGEPNCSTPIQHWTGPRVFVEKIMKGSATWLGVSPDGEVAIYEFNAEKENNGVIVYGQGWTGSWIAGVEGVEFVEICIPAFEDDGTIKVANPEDEEVAGVGIPLLFRALYHSLMELPWAEKEEKIELVGERLRLKQLGVDDAKNIFALIERNREHLSKNEDPTAGKYTSVSKVVESIVHPDPEKPGRKRFGIWNENSELVGSVNITPDKNDLTKAEIGYYLGKEYTGKGYMTEAVSMLTAFAFNELSCEIVYGIVDQRNLDSRAVLERVGYRHLSSERGEWRFELSR